jgi:hypothetical protein
MFDHSMPDKGRTPPQTAQANRQISARLHSLRKKPEGERGCSRRATVTEAGAMPAAFDPQALTENAARDSAYGQPNLFDETLTVRLAENAWEHLQAFHLLYRQYVSFGYMAENATQVRIAPHNLSLRSHVFIALKAGRVVGTLSCLEDGDNGLPADRLYPNELKQLRAQRSKLVEVGAFAADDETNGAVVMAMIQAITAFCRNTLGASDWVITVHPRHVRFYQKVMLFETLGESKACESVNAAPAVLLRLDLETMPAKLAERYSRYAGARNLHRYFFDPHETERIAARLNSANEKRTAAWPHIRRILELVGEFQTIEEWN